MNKKEMLRNLINQNKSKFFGVDFIKKDGSLRTISGHVRRVEGHAGHNPISHLDNYVTIVLPQKDSKGNTQFRNINLDTVQRISIAGKTHNFK